MNLNSKHALVIILIVLVIAIIAFSIYYFNPKQIILRKLSKIKRRAVVSLKSDEIVKVFGKALNIQEPLIAPLSKRKCIFYSIKIEKKVSSGKSSHWKAIVNEEKILNFFVEQNGSVALVKATQNPKNYISYLVVDTKVSSGAFNDPTPEFKALLKSYNIESEGFFGFNKQLRYKEGVLEIGEKITVAGIAKWQTLTEPMEGYHYTKIAALESSETQKLIITDLEEAQKINRMQV